MIPVTIGRVATIIFAISCGFTWCTLFNSLYWGNFLLQWRWFLLQVSGISCAVSGDFLLQMEAYIFTLCDQLWIYLCTYIRSLTVSIGGVSVPGDVFFRSFLRSAVGVFDIHFIYSL